MRGLGFTPRSITWEGWWRVCLWSKANAPELVMNIRPTSSYHFGLPGACRQHAPQHYANTADPPPAARNVNPRAWHFGVRWPSVYPDKTELYNKNPATSIWLRLYNFPVVYLLPGPAQLAQELLGYD